MEGRTIEEVLEATTDRLMALRGVVAVGIGDRAGSPCIRVFVAKTTPELLKHIPAAVDGYAIVVEESGPINALELE